MELVRKEWESYAFAVGAKGRKVRREARPGENTSAPLKRHPRKVGNGK
jgi:hypothetical protein